jgi:hypothetical protein
MNRLLYWSPRALSLLFVGFLSLFAFDVFEDNKGWSLVLALLIHLLPSLVLLAVTIVAWKHEIVGTIVFWGFSIWYVLMVGFERHWTWYIFIACPTTLIGSLYFVNWRKHKGRIGSKNSGTAR